MINRRCEKTDKSLAEAVAKFVDALHHKYPGAERIFRGRWTCHTPEFG